MRGRRTVRLLLLAVFVVALGQPLSAASVRFEVNDAHVKGKTIPGVKVLIATQPGGEAAQVLETDAAGAASVDLEPGTYWISYVRSGYVPIGDSETEIRREGQVITTTMSMLLEAEGAAARRRVRAVLNWGSRRSNVKDADAHVYCVCGSADQHVYFAAMRHEHLGHVVELDVDDRDWGGPETVTLSDPEPGSYRYWVHQYSRDQDTLGESDVVVRVFFDNELVGEFRIPPQITARTWKPFRQITVGPDLEPELVRFLPQELAAGADLEPPPDDLSEESPIVANGCWSNGCGVVAVGFAVFVIGTGLVAKRRRR